MNEFSELCTPTTKLAIINILIVIFYSEGGLYNNNNKIVGAQYILCR